MAGEPIVVVGGVVAGTAAARAAKRQDPDARVILVERSPFVSYVADSLPYEIADPLRPLESVVFATADEFRAEDALEILVEHEVLELDTRQRTLRVAPVGGGEQRAISYSGVVLATGARFDRRGLEGTETEGVFAPRQLHEALRLRRYLDDERPRSALVVGGGKTGLALAESLSHLGLDVLIAERGERLLPELARETARAVEHEAARVGVGIRLGAEVKRFARERGRVVAQTSDGRRFLADIAVVATGLVPEVELARRAGIALGASGAVEVDHQLHTNAPRVFAAGECAEAFDRVSRRHRFHPLPTTAFKQGEIAGANVAGAHRAFRGVVGTLALRFFEIEAARTGLSLPELDALGDRLCTVMSTQSARARPGGVAEAVTTLLHVERGSGKLLGAEMFGRGTVAKRIDVFVAALYAEMRVDDIASLDLAWAPPVSPVLDPVLVGARAARERAGVVPLRPGDDEAFTPDV